jgi:hypothetical protein
MKRQTISKVMCIICILTIVILPLSACGGTSVNKGVIGTWKNKEYGMQVKLAKDGTYTLKIRSV